MADNKKAPEAKAAAGKAGGPKKKESKLGFYTTMVFLVLLAPFIFPTVVLIFIGLFPTLFSPFSSITIRQTVSGPPSGAMNCAGITPFVIDLWATGQSMDNVFHILGQSSSWLVILGAAAVETAADHLCYSASDDVIDTRARGIAIENPQNQYGKTENHLGS